MRNDQIKGYILLWVEGWVFFLFFFLKRPSFSVDRLKAEVINVWKYALTTSKILFIPHSACWKVCFFVEINGSSEWYYSN